MCFFFPGRQTSPTAAEEGCKTGSTKQASMCASQGSGDVEGLHVESRALQNGTG